MALKPLGDNLLVKPLEQEEMTSGGIVLPDSAKEKPQKGTIVAVGTGRRSDSGEVISVDPALKVGTTVLFKKYSTTEVKDGGQEYYIIDESGIIAIVE